MGCEIMGCETLLYTRPSISWTPIWQIFNFPDFFSHLDNYSKSWTYRQFVWEFPKMSGTAASCGLCREAPLGVSHTTLRHPARQINVCLPIVFVNVGKKGTRKNGTGKNGTGKNGTGKYVTEFDVRKNGTQKYLHVMAWVSIITGINYGFRTFRHHETTLTIASLLGASCEV